MLAVLIPLLSAMIYPLGTLSLKRALERGADMWGGMAVNYWVMALVFFLVAPLESRPVPWELWWQPALVGVFSFLGQLFAYRAVAIGDLTIATPAMGSKVLLVALFTELLLGQQVPLAWWVSAALAFAAVLLLQAGVQGSKGHMRLTLALSLLAATFFSLGDVLIQRFAPAWGPFHFVPAFAAVTAVLSLSLLPAARRPLLGYPAAAWLWLLPGVLLLSLQALGLTLAIGLFGEATLANIVYSSRGLWNFLFIWYGGHLFGNREREAGAAIMVKRLIGAALIFIAIVLASIRI